MSYNKILQQLKSNGFRITKIRLSLIELFLNGNHALSVQEILQKLKIRKLHPNKTTIYRELTFLINQKIIIELQFSDDKKRYESALSHHHHHLVCTKCEAIQDVVLGKDLEVEERHIAKYKQFKVMNHTLEFFGLCAECQ